MCSFQKWALFFLEAIDTSIDMTSTEVSEVTEVAQDKEVDKSTPMSQGRYNLRPRRLDFEEAA